MGRHACGRHAGELVRAHATDAGRPSSAASGLRMGSGPQHCGQVLQIKASFLITLRTSGTTWSGRAMSCTASIVMTRSACAAARSHPLVRLASDSRGKLVALRQPGCSCLVVRTVCGSVWQALPLCWVQERDVQPLEVGLLLPAVGRLSMVRLIQMLTRGTEDGCEL
jgi:hypothetical protein